MNPIREAVAPYLLWIKLGFAALALVLAFLRGCSVQRDRDGAIIAKKDAAIEAAATALRGAAGALREVNAEAARQIKAADDQAKAASQAGKVAEAARDKAQQESDRFAAEVDRAKKRRPACAELLKQSLEASCGLSAR